MNSLDQLQRFLSDGLEGKAETTIKTYAHALKQFSEYLSGREANLTDYTRIDVQDYINYLTAKKKSASTINKIFQAITTFSRWSNRSNTVEKVRVIKQVSPLQTAPESIERNKLLKLMRTFEKEGNARNIAILMVLAGTGIRVSELVSLDVSDVEISERKGSIRIRNGKGAKERHVPINSDVRDSLNQYLLSRKSRSCDNSALFLSNRNSRISVRMVQTLFESHGIHVHQFRHTFITALKRANKDDSMIMAMTGHTNAQMIARYSRPTFDDCAEAVENLFA
jgi:integrase/recombinase XerC/integrase/recombinase XerD